MNYDVKYKDMKVAVESFYTTARSLDRCVQRLDEVKKHLGWFEGSAVTKAVSDRARLPSAH